VSQLKRLGIPWVLAEVAADNVDWHQIARLVQCGCPPELALRIVHLAPKTPIICWSSPETGSR
jgi:hypothetical protein